MGSNDWQKSTGQNVYEMFVEHGGPGFWIRRTTWGGTCARVIRIGEMTKPAPYFGSPTALMDVYSLDGASKEGLAQVRVPGTFKTWRKIDAPAWEALVDLRPLDDPNIDAALAALDRKRGKGKREPVKDTDDAVPVARVRLKVPFERKEEAKSIGARWWPEEKTWWLPQDKSAALAQARSLGFFPEDE
ncbi:MULTISPECIES: DUF5710 domain-containing protein [Sinorhizobium]|uniref:DUF5710 domain-containing protein n=1 Tax=Sinorhizobium TaxID=28105 RepID=UPI000BEB68E1|nr:MULTISPECIES: DUF5710 domain-containing protein [Sinorhizobium]PDT50906.1 hypothetical protein CO664_24460 [Sinorhizobium sp. NG07B]POH25027.1 hypothetical protein ATY30_28720 [Sinorhizobium americanum]